jgi:hypothetical protein
MAITIKTRQDRTEVRPNFWVALSHLGKRHAIKITDEMRTMPEQQRKRWAKRYAARLQMISRIRKRDDRILTSLTRAGWDYLDGEYAFDDHWLVLHLNDVICEPVKKSATKTKYKMGGYKVYIPGKSLVDTNLAYIHFVPDRGPENNARHPHHYVTGESHLDPLQRATHTCWGGYQDWLQGAMKQWELPDMLYALKQFLTHYTPGDTLKRPSTTNFPWIETIR